MSIYELIDWTYPPPGEGPRPYFGYSLDRDTNKYVAHRPPATPMTSIVKLERDDTVDLGDDPQWKETLRAISMLEGWLFTTWGTDIEQATLVVLIVGQSAICPD